MIDALPIALTVEQWEIEKANGRRQLAELVASLPDDDDEESADQERRIDCDHAFLHRFGESCPWCADDTIGVCQHTAETVYCCLCGWTASKA